MALLALHEVRKSYGALRVTDGISLAVEQGETLGILGPNGAGKTTLFNLVSGDVRADDGCVEFDGRDVTGLPPHQRCRAGIGRSYQVPQPFGGMTVFENLVTAACFGGRQREREAWQTARDVLEDTGLIAHANQRARAHAPEPQAAGTGAGPGHASAPAAAGRDRRRAHRTRGAAACRGTAPHQGPRRHHGVDRTRGACPAGGQRFPVAADGDVRR